MRRVLASALALGLAGCSPIVSKQYVAQPIGQRLQAGVGGVIIHMDKKRNLENVFGRSDVFGRKTNEGYAELRFMGVEGDKAIFRRIDVAISSDETTMSRSGGTY